MKSPLVSIITTSLNSSSTILKTIKSVDEQTYKHIEHIFIDGGSKDNTVKIINQNSNRIVKIISEKDRGIYDAMNKGINCSKGDIIGILNSDDKFASNEIIYKIVNSFCKHKCDILYGNINYVNNNDRIIRSWNSSSYKKGSFLYGWHPPHPSLFLNKSVYNFSGLFDLNFKIAADFEFMLRIFTNNLYKKKYLDEIFVNMMIGGASNTLKGIIKGNKEIRLAFRKNKLKPKNFYFIRRYFSKFKDYLK